MAKKVKKKNVSKNLKKVVGSKKLQGVKKGIVSKEKKVSRGNKGKKKVSKGLLKVGVISDIDMNCRTGKTLGYCSGCHCLLSDLDLLSSRIILCPRCDLRQKLGDLLRDLGGVINRDFSKQEYLNDLNSDVYIGTSFDDVKDIVIDNNFL